MLVSGAWDNLVLIWDIRQELPVSHILGPNISGESIDIKDHKLLIGSYADHDNLEVVDLDTFKITEKIEWTSLKSTEKHPPYIYSAKFSRPFSTSGIIHIFYQA